MYSAKIVYFVKLSCILIFPLAVNWLRVLLYKKVSAIITDPSLVVIFPLSKPFILFPFSNISISVTLNSNCSKAFILKIKIQLIKNPIK